MMRQHRVAAVYKYSSALHIHSTLGPEEEVSATCRIWRKVHRLTLVHVQPAEPQRPRRGKKPLVGLNADEKREKGQSAFTTSQVNHLNPNRRNHEGIQHCSCSDTRARLCLRPAELRHPGRRGKNLAPWAPPSLLSLFSLAINVWPQCAS